MTYSFNDAMTLKDFYTQNAQLFEQTLIEEAATVKKDVRDILQRGNINLVANAHQFVSLAFDENEEELKAFAEQEGIVWAAQDIELSFRLEWVHALRRTIWLLIEAYQTHAGEKEFHDFFHWERKINNQVDAFLHTFLKSYSNYKETLIQNQEQLVDYLSTPVIPLGRSICVLPLIGPIDRRRLGLLEENVLMKVAEQKIQVLIIDLSGAELMEKEEIKDFIRIIDGVSLMGSEIVLTGVPGKLAMDHALFQEAGNSRIKTLGTLQRAVNEYFVRK
ncbi:STAS domain-containing protein [Marinococcus luteus]|uniref:STAS domain-containing protein n=1 Tax=Marinococcus luteus TaxID=1122204 RepID=UPI002ACC3EBB|nr:STAS domain-containing protein [Marinococcus luteus]MDZ5781911.1 STAS domain-containing protein [Marinococcus luteus]